MYNDIGGYPTHGWENGHERKPGTGKGQGLYQMHGQGIHDLQVLISWLRPE